MALGEEVKSAATEVSVFIVTEQVLLVEVQAPLQLVKLEILFGIAVNDTEVPVVNDDWHELEVQAIPDGILLMEPPPEPVKLSVSVCVAAFELQTLLHSSIIRL
jgi:hypothetical protein